MIKNLLALACFLSSAVDASAKYSPSYSTYKKTTTTYTPTTYSSGYSGYGGHTSVYVAPTYSYGYNNRGHTTVVATGGGGSAVGCIICCLVVFVLFAIVAANGRGGSSDEYEQVEHGGVTTVVEETVTVVNPPNFSFPMGFGPGIPPPPVPPPQMIPPGMYVPQTYCSAGHAMQWFNMVPPTYPGAMGVTCEVCTKDIPVDYWFTHCPMCQVDLCQPCANNGFAR